MKRPYQINKNPTFNITFFKQVHIFVFIIIFILFTYSIFFYFYISQSQKEMLTSSYNFKESLNTILQTEKFLTILINMSVHSGNTEYLGQYSEEQTKLDSIVNQLTTCVSYNKLDEYILKIQNSYKDIRKTEKDIIELLKKRKLNDALKLINSKSYRDQKQNYYKNIKQCSKLLDEYIKTKIKPIYRRKLFPVLHITGSILILFLLMIAALYFIRKYLSEYIKMEDTIQKSEKFYREFFENAPDVIYSIYTDGLIHSLSPSFEKITGWKCDEWIGKPFGKIVHPDDLSVAMSTFQQVLQGEIPKPYELRILSKTGEYLIGEFISIPKFEGNKIVAEVGIVRDITERKKIEEKLRSNETKLKGIVETVNTGIFIIQGTKYIFFNSKFEQMTGYSKDELLSMNFWEVIHPKFQNLVRDRGLARQRNENVPSRYETIIRNKKGEDIWVEFNGTIIELETKNCILGIVYDITERKKSEEILLNSLTEARQYSLEISTLLEISRSILEQKDFKDTAKTIINSCKRLFKVSIGYITLLSKEENEHEIIYSDLGQQEHNIDQSIKFIKISGLPERVYKTGKSFYVNDFMNSEWQKHVPEKHIKIDNLLFAPLKIRNKIIGIIGIANKADNFTTKDEKMLTAIGELTSVALHNSLTIESLRHSEEKFRSVIQSITDAIITIDKNCNIVFWNNSAENMYKYSCDEILGRHIKTVIPDYIEVYYNGKCELNQFKEPISPKKIIKSIGLKKDGTEFPIEISFSKWETKEGIFITSLVRDITERIKTEKEREELYAQLIQSSKLATIGELAAGLAHEIGNPLQTILGNTDLLLLDKKFDELISIKNAALHARQIIENLINISRERNFNFVLADINDIIDNVLSFYGKQLENKKIRLIKKYEKLQHIYVSCVHIQQVFINIITNAVQSMPEGGTLSITTKKVDDMTISVSLKDTGVGILRENFDKIFKPFYTTRKDGAGLGLSISYEIVKQHGGRIEVLSDGINKGAEFIVYLPIMQKS